jgi:uncharacterized membrane protein YhhN
MAVGALWIAQCVLFGIGMVGPWRDPPSARANGRVPRSIRMALSFSLVGAAALIWAGSTASSATYTRWVVAGMAASCVGDLVMARLIPLPNRLIGGMVAFGLAHACYITAFFTTAQRNGGDILNPALWCALAAYTIATASGWWVLIHNPQKQALLNTGALCYGLWISVMASCGLALAWTLGGQWWLAAAGGLVFMASDFLIGVTDIRGTAIRNANDWIWLTYVGGQMGIIYAAWL